MRISHSHWQRVAAILIGWAGALGIGSLAGAEPVIDPALAASQGPSVDFNEMADTGGNAASGNAAREMLRMERRWITSGLGHAPGALARSDVQATAPPSAPFAGAAAANGLANRTPEFNGTVKDAVRPFFEELADSSFVAAVRDLESELGLKRRWSLNDPAAGSTDYPQNTGRGADAQAVSWQRGGAQAEPDKSARSAGQIEVDRVAARSRIERYVEEIKSWLLGMVGLLVVAYLVKLALDYRRWKNARRRRHGAKSLRRRRRRFGSRSFNPLRTRAQFEETPWSPKLKK